MMIADRNVRNVWPIACVAVLAACATHERIILLPEADGRPSTLVVRQGDREVVLDKPYAATELTIADPWRYDANAEEVRAAFGEALAVQPARAAHYTLYFVEGSDDLTEESRRALEQVFADLDKRPVRDVVIVGHTDTVGNDQYNDALARKRADAVGAMLVARGVDQRDITSVGRGKRDLLVPTPDGVAEPRNRRVEIVVR
jgi:outer membrane protein OmpA-like peptidoglycan-associated protein